MLGLVLRRLTLTGLRRGLGGSRGWLYVGAAAITLRVLRRIANDEEVLYRTAIRAGDVFEIVTGRPGR